MEPGLVEEDFKEIAEKGVWLAKAGFGAVETPYDYAPMDRYLVSGYRAVLACC